MAKTKCKHCSTTLSSGDKHSYCEVCRKSKKGDYPCVKGRTCKFCDCLAKSAGDKKKSSELVDDSLLDDDDPPKVIYKVAASTESNSSNSALQQTIELLASQVKSLTERMDARSPSAANYPPSTSSASAMPSNTASMLSSESHQTASRSES